MIDDLDLYDRFCHPAKVQRVMAWTRGCTFTPKYSLRKKYAHIAVTGKTAPLLSECETFNSCWLLCRYTRAAGQPQVLHGSLSGGDNGVFYGTCSGSNHTSGRGQTRKYLQKREISSRGGG